jgi:class 3 adenylate cyclase
MNPTGRPLSSWRDARDALRTDRRAGLHAGEIEVTDGDVAGLAVHVAARVAALAGADEILVSSTIRDLVVGSALTFADRGSRALKGVPGRWRLFGVEPREADRSVRSLLWRT